MRSKGHNRNSGKGDATPSFAGVGPLPHNNKRKQKQTKPNQKRTNQAVLFCHCWLGDLCAALRCLSLFLSVVTRSVALDLLPLFVIYDFGLLLMLMCWQACSRPSQPKPAWSETNIGIQPKTQKAALANGLDVCLSTSVKFVPLDAINDRANKKKETRPDSTGGSES